MRQLGRLLAEQNSPAEVIVFLVLVMAVFLVVAFLVYVLILLILRPGLPSGIPFRRVLFPSAAHVRAHVAEYSLAFFTALLMSLTLSVKHDLVSQIENFKMSQVDITEVERLFDFGLPEGLSRELSTATLDDVVQPMLAAGKVEEAGLLVRSVIAMGLPDGWLTPGTLVTVALVLSMVYLVWFALRRLKTLRAQPTSPPSYASTLRSLLMLALCVGLLLTATLPLANGGEKMLANSALNAIAFESRSTRRPTPVSNRIAEELATQRQWATYLYCPDCQMPRKSIWEVVDGDSGGLDRLFSGLDSLERDVAACRDDCTSELERLRDGLDQERGRLDLLINGMRSADTRFQELQADLGELERTLTTSTQRLLDEQDQKIRRWHTRDLQRVAEQIPGLKGQIKSIEDVLEGNVSLKLNTLNRRLNKTSLGVARLEDLVDGLEGRVRTLESYHGDPVQ